jgi:outer membrane protein assembly factor BamA
VTSYFGKASPASRPITETGVTRIVRFDPDVVDREPKIFVTFQITEGQQTVVENLTIEGNNARALQVPDVLFRLRSLLTVFVWRPGRKR